MLKIGSVTLAAVIFILAVGAMLIFFMNPLRRWLGLYEPRTYLVFSGNIEAHQSVLSFQSVQSRIIALPFYQGQWVKKETLLAKLDPSDYERQVRIAEVGLQAQQRQLSVARQNLEAAAKSVSSNQADHALKQLQFNRAQTLFRKGSGTVEARDLARAALDQSAAVLERDRALVSAAERTVEVAEANVQSSKANLGLAQIVLGHTALYAPFDGIVLVRQAELGEIAVPGGPIVTLADLDHVWLRAYVNEPDLGKVRYGQTVTVTTDSYPGKKSKGNISFISSSAEFTPKTVETHAERVSLVYRIRIDINNSDHELVLGMPADARLELPLGSAS